MLVFVALVMAVKPAPADQVLPQNIAQLAAAKVAFLGKCVEAKPSVMNNEKIHGLFVTTYKFEVKPEGVIKGDVGKTFTFTQFGGTREAARRNKAPYVAGLPTYEVGKEYTLFLTASPIGLMAPVGLGYGTFDMKAGAGGKLMAVNRYNNRGLFKDQAKGVVVSKALSASGAAVPASKGGPISFDTLKAVVKNIK
jgi:hypothetical protein